MSSDGFDYFGDPNAPRDIARSDTVVDDLFIETAAIRWFLRRDPEYHVIVGSKGTGKSLLLFKKAVLATKKPGVVVAPAPPQKAYAPGLAFADAERWVPFWPLIDADGRPLLVQWAGLWEWALLITIAHAWRGYARRQSDRSLTSELDELIGTYDESNPFSLIADGLQSMATGTAHVRGQPVLPDARRLRAFVSRNVGKLPPPYVFLDNQDDLFFDYPDFWTASGQGCFLAMQSLQESTNHRIHIFVTLRPEIVSELAKMQHFPQWTADIFRLRWTDDELIDVLRSRARHLRRDLIPSPELLDDDPLDAFVGREFYDERHDDYVIPVPLASRNGETARVIPVRDQLLRHSLRRPREMIILGNAILDARRRVEGHVADPALVLREAVDEKAANDIAKPYLAEVKHHWPWGSPPEQALRQFIVKRINKNVLSRAEVRRIEREFAADPGVSLGDSSPIVTLASLGLIGWPMEDSGSGGLTQHFVLPGEQDVDALPVDIGWFLVHPVLYAAPFCVKVVPGNIVGPGLPFDPALQLAPPEYHPAILCSGEGDRDLAGRLQRDLQAHGVACSVIVPGVATGDTAVAGAARLVVLCSAEALENRELLRAIDEQVEGYGRKVIVLSRDAEWRTAEFTVSIGGRDLKPVLLKSRPIPFGDEVESASAVRSLLTRLKKRRKPTEARGR